MSTCRLVPISCTTIPIVFIIACLLVPAMQQSHVLYNVKNPKRISEGSCSSESPETFFHSVAEPSLSLLYYRSRAFFGILMDQIESSSSSNGENKPDNKTREQWEFITTTVSGSLDSAVDRTETSWTYFVIIHEVQPLPWEIQYKKQILHEALYELEYSYTMIDAVIRSGTKEIVGTLQHHLTDVIRNLEKEVSKISKIDNEVTEQNLYKQMKKALKKMKSTFTTKLLEKVVGRAMDRYGPAGTLNKSLPSKDTFISESLNQMALVLHAFREKGAEYPNFWNEMAKIFATEYKIKGKADENEIVVDFMRELSNQETLINLIVQIISRDNKS